MKSLGILIIFWILGINQDELEGKYKIEYEQKYKAQNGIVIFKDNTYERKLVNRKIIKGKIIYKQYSIELKDIGNNLQIDFFKGDISKDTIYFSTKELNKTVDNNDIIINSGKLIKLKR